MFPDQLSRNLFAGFSAITLIAIFSGILLEENLLVLIPLGLLMAAITIVDFKKIYYLLIVATPISTEYYFSSGLSTDLPTEPLMVILMGVFLFVALLKPEKIDPKFIQNRREVGMQKILEIDVFPCFSTQALATWPETKPVSYTHLRAHET